MKLRSIPHQFHKSFVDRLAKGLSVRSKFEDRHFVAPADAFEPPTLAEVEQEETSIGLAIDEYIADQQEQHSYA